MKAKEACPTWDSTLVHSGHIWDFAEAHNTHLYPENAPLHPWTGNLVN